SRLESDDALVPRPRRAKLGGRWAVGNAEIRPYASPTSVTPASVDPPVRKAGVLNHLQTT
ncbi:unnamed protein product, partial [Clavelina lepadiformis]